MIEAQLTAGLMMLFLKVLEKGVDNVIDAGYKDAAQGVKNLLKGSQAEQEILRLQGIVEKLAKESFANGKEGDLFSHKPFLQQIVSVIVDPLFDYDFDQLGEAYIKKFENYPQLKDDIKRFIKNLEKILIKDQYWGDVIERFRQIRDNHEIKQKLADLQLPVRESEIVSQEIINIDTNIENIETFINTYFHVEKYVEQEIHNHFTPDYEGQRLKENEQKALSRYLNQLKTYCYNLPLSALGDDDNRLMDVQLKEIYINLNTTAELEDREEKMPGDRTGEGLSYEKGIVNKVYQVVPRDLIKKKNDSLIRYYKMLTPVFLVAKMLRKMVLLGGPGSGKSTFVKYLLGQYIEGELSKEDFEEDLLPVLINFREISRDLAQLELKGKPADEQEKNLADLLKEKIQAKVCGDGCLDLTSYFEEHWHTGALFLVLDGLDEVPEDQRAHIRQTVQAVEKTIHPKRILLTCRVRSYMGEAVLTNWYAFTLAPLDEEKIDHFIKIWYDTTAPKLGLPKEQKEKRIEDLQAAARRDSLEELSKNPMLLTTMTLIHQREAFLPDQRVKVYKQAVELLVRRWQRYQGGDFKVSKDLDDFLNKEEKLYPLLELIAYHTHQSIKGDLNKPELLELVQKTAFPRNYNLADEFLGYIDHRSGLLAGTGSEPGKPNLFSFPHRTFQEYLAGCYLASRDDMEELLHALALEQDRWYLPVQYAVEYLFYFEKRGKSILRSLAFILNQPFKRADERGQRKLLWAGYIVRLFGKAHFENNNKLPYDGHDFLKSLQERLIACFGGALSPQEWVEIGEILAEIGDPRFYGKELFYLPKDETLGFVEVPAGKFWMGEEKELHQVELPTYYLNKTMTTVAQFRFFSEKAKYTNFDKNALKDKNNQPVLLVTWYDAIKYCEWLQKELIKSAETPVWIREKLNQGWRITLPSEAEWEKAARGNTKNKFPWGNEINPEDANYRGTQIGGPSAVGCFPGHGLFDQFYDLSGNLWELTRSKYEKYPYKTDERESLKGKEVRVLRGGSFIGHVVFLSCAIRYGFDPFDRFFDFIGFRIVLSPPPQDTGSSGR